MFSTARLKTKILIDKLAQRQAIINQAISIQDIFVYSDSSIYLKYHDSSLEKLIDHVAMLASLANEYHQQYYCDKDNTGNYIIKPSCLNKITRLSLSEFSLYTSAPMNMEDFNSFLNSVAKIASQQQSNVHLLLSSFSVVLEDNTQLNMCLYVQCGMEPNLVSFCKTNSHQSDLQYSGYKIFSRSNIDLDKNENQDNLKKISAYIVTPDTNCVISNDTVFLIKTKGGAEYLQVVDICADYKHGHSKNLIEMANDEEQTHFIPDQVDHIVTSLGLHVSSQAVIKYGYSEKKPEVAMLVVQIDNRHPYRSNIQHNIPSLVSLPLNKQRYPDTKIEKYRNILKVTGFKVKNPPFGDNIKVIIRAERALSGFASHLKQRIDERNKRIMENILRVCSANTDNNTFKSQDVCNSVALRSTKYFL